MVVVVAAERQSPSLAHRAAQALPPLVGSRVVAAVVVAVVVEVVAAVTATCYCERRVLFVWAVGRALRWCA